MIVLLMCFAAVLFRAVVPGRRFSQVEKREKKVGRDDGKRMRKTTGGIQYKVVTAPGALLCVYSACVCVQTHVCQYCV